MKKDDAIEILKNALFVLLAQAAEYEQDNTPQLSRALNKASAALTKVVESKLD